MIWASPAASFRSVLLGRTFKAALAWRASMQMTGRPRSCNSFQSQTARGPVSIPMRSRLGVYRIRNEESASGQVGIFFSATMRPASSTIQMAVASCDTSSAAKVDMELPLRLRSKTSFNAASLGNYRPQARGDPAITLSGPP